MRLGFYSNGKKGPHVLWYGPSSLYPRWRVVVRKDYQVLFSERYGYAKPLRIGRYAIKLEKYR